MSVASSSFVSGPYACGNLSNDDVARFSELPRRHGLVRKVAVNESPNFVHDFSSNVVGVGVKIGDYSCVVEFAEPTFLEGKCGYVVTLGL